MDWEREWERLNPYQREAVTDENKACLVSANVGERKNDGADCEDSLSP